MALCLVDGHFRKTTSTAAAPVLPPLPTPPTKRPRADSASSYESGADAGLPIPALSNFRPAPRFKLPRGGQMPPPVFTRGGSRGGQRGGANPAFQKGSGYGQGTSGQKSR